MKKIISVFLIIIILVFSLSITNIYVKDKNEDTQPNNILLVEKIYNNWDEAKYAGEFIIDNKVGLLKFRGASRIDNSEKFKVTYVSVSKKN